MSYSDWCQIFEYKNQNTDFAKMQIQYAWITINNKLANYVQKKLCFEVYVNEFFNETQYEERLDIEIPSKYSDRIIHLNGINRYYRDKEFREIYNNSIKEKQNLLSKNLHNIISLCKINTEKKKLHDDIIISINKSFDTFITKEEMDIIIIKYIIYHMLYITDPTVTLYLE